MSLNITPTRLLVLFLIIEIFQLSYYLSSPSPQDEVPLTLDLVFSRCLKSYNLAVRSRQNLTLPEHDPQKNDADVEPIRGAIQPIFRPKVECKEGFWDGERSLCVCDQGFMGERCSIPITYCNEDLDREKVFDDIYEKNYWGSKESKSGPGSAIQSTFQIRKFLPEMVEKYNISSLFDSPCGDLNWLKTIEFPVKFQYVGADVVKKIVKVNREKYMEVENYNFVHRDAVMFPPYKRFDLIFARDILQHLNHEDRDKVIKNWENSGSKYVMTTYFTGKWRNDDIKTGDTRYVNVMEPPYNFEDPIEKIVDGNTDNDKDWVKNIGLWKLPI